MTFWVRSTVSRAAALGTAALLIAGCDTPIADQALDLPLQLHEDMSVTEFQTQLGSGAVRVEITVDPERPLARRIEVQSANALTEEEEITSAVTDLDFDDAGGHLTLALGDLRVGFTRETRFELANGEGVSIDAFVAGVAVALAEGFKPPIQVERRPGDAVQNPDDPTFDADRIRLLFEQHRPQIEITVDADNLRRNDAPPPDGWITVLGLELEIRVSEGLTEIAKERPEIEKQEFEGVVSAVDLEAGSFTLEDGTLIYVVNESDFDHGDAMPRFERLEIVAQAIEAGLTVVAHGVGAVRSDDPLVLVALKLRFAVRSHELIEFRGMVASVSVEDLAFKMEDGTLVRLLDITHVGGEGGDPENALRRVLVALEEGKEVHVHGAGIEVGEEPRVIVALKVEFGANTPLEEFRGVARSVDEVERVVTLADGIIIQITDETTIHQSDDPQVLSSLEEVGRALDAGEAVLVKGIGVVTSEDPLVIEAMRIVFVLEPPPMEHFEGRVTDVDVDGMVVKLENGTIVQLDENTSIHHELNDQQTLGSLAEVAEALTAGYTVVTGGFGIVENEVPLTILARKIVFVKKRPDLERFEGVVAEVMVDAGKALLEDGTVLVIGPDTKFHVNDERRGLLGSLEEVASALEAGHTVVAIGLGTVSVTATSADPRTIDVVEVAFIAKPTAVEFFSGTVASVDVEGGLVKLESGLVVQLTDDTEIVGTDHGLNDLHDVAMAISEGDTVVAAGIGHVASSDPPVIVAIQVLFIVAAP